MTIVQTTLNMNSVKLRDIKRICKSIVEKVVDCVVSSAEYYYRINNSGIWNVLLQINLRDKQMLFHNLSNTDFELELTSSGFPNYRSANQVGSYGLKYFLGYNVVLINASFSQIHVST